MNNNSDILAMIRRRSENYVPAKRESDPALAYFLLGVFVACAFLAKLFG